MSSLRVRIFLLFCALLLLIEAVTLVTVRMSMREQVDRGIQQQLAVGREVFLSQFESRREHLSLYSRVIARDYGLVSTLHDDPRSLQVALDNHRNRVGADLAVITDMDGIILADTQRPESAGELFEPLVGVHRPFRDNRFLRYGQNNYQLVVAPLLAPNPVGQLYLGFVIDDALARHFESITSLQVTFIADGGGDPAVVASTMSGDQHDVLARQAGDLLNRRAVISVDGHRYVSMAIPLGQRQGRGMTVLLQQSQDAALSAYGPWWQRIAEVSLLILLAGFAGAWLLARGVVQPVRLLARQADAIAGGHYDRPISIQAGNARKGEIGELVRAFGQMQTAIAEREQSIRHNAYHDSLTGLYNRHRLEQVIEQKINPGAQEWTRCAVLVLDLNRFRDINDTLGHHAGDRLLVSVGQRLRAVSGGEAIIARLAGDEFAVVLHGVSVSSLKDWLDGLHSALSRPFEEEDLELHIGSSIGIAVFPEHGHDAPTLLRHADTARIAAKDKHAPYEIYSGSQDRYSLLRVSLLGEMRSAMDRGDMLLHFQPKLDLQRGVVSEVEALLRWHHPVYGMIPPGDFISMVEHTGNIHVLTMWVIRMALRQAAAWKNEGLALGVAVNISAQDLRNPDLIEGIRSHLEDTGMQPGRLRLEVTESGVVEDDQAVMGSLQQLHRMGIELSIDDYGTGYSSLAQLKRLPVSELKIDKSFVRSMDADEDDEIIVRSTIELGHLMGMSVCAEGVESATTLKMLAGLGCEMAQGHHVARPMPGERVLSWAQEQESSLQLTDPTE